MMNLSHVLCNTVQLPSGMCQDATTMIKFVHWSKFVKLEYVYCRLLPRIPLKNLALLIILIHNSFAYATTWKGLWPFDLSSTKWFQMKA